ncbi:hypothetical protein [Arthrobacter sp. D1-17]
MLNPKAGVFHIATIPQFIPARISPLLMGILLAGVHCLLATVWFILLIFGTGYAAGGLKGPEASVPPKHPYHRQHHRNRPRGLRPETW